MKKIYLILSILCLSLCVKAQEPTKFKVALKDGTVNTYNISDIDYMSVEADVTPGGDKPDILAGSTYIINPPAIGASDDCKVWSVMSGDNQVAEVCYEYIKNTYVDERMLVVYPIGSNGKADLTKGYVPANQGGLRWDLASNSCTYNEGNGIPVTTLYLEDGQFRTSTTAEVQATTVSQYMLKDVRGNEKTNYSVVKVGTQYWMAENLRATKLNDGTDIMMYKATQGSAWNNASSPAYHVYLDGENPDIITTWGCMYNGYTVTSDKMAPEGWSITTHADWQALKSYLAIGQSSKVKAKYGWNDTPGNGDNISGLGMEPGGFFLYTSVTDDQDQFSRASYWTTDKYTDSTFGGNTLGAVYIYNKIMLTLSDGAPLNHSYSYGHYIRCIRK